VVLNLPKTVPHLELSAVVTKRIAGKTGNQGKGRKHVKMQKKKQGNHPKKGSFGGARGLRSQDRIRGGGVEDSDKRDREQKKGESEGWGE